MLGEFIMQEKKESEIKKKSLEMTVKTHKNNLKYSLFELKLNFLQSEI